VHVLGGFDDTHQKHTSRRMQSPIGCVRL